MVDIVDIANEHIEAELALAIQAARGIPGARVTRHTRCVDCHEPLLAHRLVYGICLGCQEQREARGRLG
jgi:hypothetical protein